MAEDETSKLLPPLPRPLLSALSSLQNPLCPYAIDLEAPPPTRKRRPGPDSPLRTKPPAFADKSHHHQQQQRQQQQQQQLNTSFTFAHGQNNQRLAESAEKDAEPTMSTDTRKAEEPVDEDSLILTIKASVFLRSHWLKEIGFWFLNFITAGILALICRWYPTLLRKLRYVVVLPDDPRAEMVLVTSLDNIESYATILALDMTDLTQGWQPTGMLRKVFAKRNNGDDVAGHQAVVASPRMFIWRHERFWFNSRRGGGGGGGGGRGAGLWFRRGFDSKRSYGEIHRISTERLEETLFYDVALDRAFARVLTYGENQLDVTTPPFPTLILHELLKPFFAFQLFSIVIWILQAYYIYMYVVVGLSVVSIIQSAYAEHQNLRALERLAKADGVINKIRLSGTGGGGGGGGGVNPMGYSISGSGGLPRSGFISTAASAVAEPAAAEPAAAGASVCLTADPVATSSLQPGDIVHISTNMILPCDVLLLTGSVVMSEAMLTGESAPVLKSALPLDAPQTVFKPDSDRDGRYVLFSGTKVLQAKCGSLPPVPQEDLAADGLRCLWEFGLPVSHTTDHHHHHHRHHHYHHKHAGSISFDEMPAMGLVLRTGFSTARGQLIRAILFPKPSKFDFERQTFLFMRILLLVLSIGIAFQIGIYHRNGVTAYKTFLDSLNLVTVAVPPALPLALSVGISVALARLKSYGIFCSDSSRISAAGRVNCLCFDKTGTLTTDGLTLKGVACVQHNHHHHHHQQQQQQQQQQEESASGMGSHTADATGGNGNGSNSKSCDNNTNGLTTKTLGSELIADVTRLHTVALEEGVRKAASLSRNNSAISLSSNAGGEGGAVATARSAPPSLTTATTSVTTSAASSAAVNLLKEEADPARNHKLMLSYVMAACHSISILDQTDDATALVLRLNSEIIADPSCLPERRQFLETYLEERGLLSTVEEFVLDPEHDENIVVKVEVEDESEGEGEDEGRGVGGGQWRQMGRVGSSGGREGGSSGRNHSASYDEEDEEPILDLPTMVYTDNVTEKTQHLVGDSLEILCFQESGWRYCVRPSEPPNLTELLRTMGPGALNRLFRDGAFDDFNIWRHPRLASYVDTVLLPPKSLKGTRHSSALAMVRRFDFDSDLRRMAAIIRTLPNLEPSGPGATATTRRSRGERRDFRYDQAGQHFMLVKGAPESIRDICLPETLPVDLEVQLQTLTLSGYRVLACGTRALEHLPEGEILKGTREELERDLTFVGLLVMENALKEETTGYLRDYARAGLRQIMVTGDNPLTALAISKMAGSAFLCAWRRPLLVDLAMDPERMEMRLAVLDAFDPTLRWDLLDYLQKNLGKALVTMIKAGVEAGLEEREEEQVVLEVECDEGEGGDGVARNSHRPPLIPGRLVQRSPSSKSSSSNSGPAIAKSKAAPALAAVEFVCTGRAFAALVTQHTPVREDVDCDGEAWTALEVVLLKCNVFARMSPHNKQELMRSLQDLDYVVCMTGDGANDSGALKAADIGISIASAKNVLLVEPGGGKKEEGAGAVAPIGKEGDEDEERVDYDNPENAKIASEISTAEAAVTAAPSIAAPFATGLHHIGAVCTVVTEGRGTLATSFSMFKYMFLYGIIQFCGVLILYAYLLELSPMQYLYADLFVVLPFVTFMPSMEATPKLTRGTPETNLVSFPVMRSIFGHSALIIFFQLFQQWLLLQQNWYHGPDYDAPSFDRQVTIASSSKFLFSNFMYIFLAIALCQTFGLFRVPVYKNIVLSALVVTEIAASILLLVLDWPIFDHLFQVQGAELVPAYRHKLLGWGLVSGFAFVLYERYFVPHKSLDDDPVLAAPPRRILTVSATDTAFTGTTPGVEDQEEQEEDQEGLFWSVFNGEIKCVPNLWHRTPLYHRFNAKHN